MRDPLYVSSDGGVQAVGPPPPNGMADMLRHGGFRATGLPLRQALGIGGYRMTAPGRARGGYGGIGGGGFAGGGGFGYRPRRRGHAGAGIYGAAPLFNPFVRY